MISGAIRSHAASLKTKRSIKPKTASQKAALNHASLQIPRVHTTWSDRTNQNPGSALSGAMALPFSGTLERVGEGFQPNRIGLRHQPFQWHPSMIFADDCHGFPVVQLPLGIGLGVSVVAVECDEFIDEF